VHGLWLHGRVWSLQYARLYRSQIHLLRYIPILHHCIGNKLLCMLLWLRRNYFNLNFLDCCLLPGGN
jgi:hypothetical protein